MSLLSSNDRMLLFYELALLRRIKRDLEEVKAIRRRRYGAGIGPHSHNLANIKSRDHDLLDGLLDDDHTQYVPVDGVARQLADAGYPNALLLDGSRAMTGDWLVFPDIALKSVSNYLQVWNAAKTYLRHIRCDMLNPNSIQMYPPTGIKIQIDSYCNFQTYQSATSYWNLSSHTGSAFQTAIKLIGGLAELPFAKLTGDLDVNTNAIGPLLIDRTTAEKRRIYLDNGILGDEAV